VQNRMEGGQLVETSLTLRDLEEIIDSFTSTLRGVFHPRIQYPQMGSELLTRPQDSYINPNQKTGD
jgi:membrane-associated HD superfamily phosphohydrolase